MQDIELFIWESDFLSAVINRDYTKNFEQLIEAWYQSTEVDIFNDYHYLIGLSLNH